MSKYSNRGKRYLPMSIRKHQQLKTVVVLGFVYYYTINSLCSKVQYWIFAICPSDCSLYCQQLKDCWIESSVCVYQGVVKTSKIIFSNTLIIIRGLLHIWNRNLKKNIQISHFQLGALPFENLKYILEILEYFL